MTFQIALLFGACLVGCWPPVLATPESSSQKSNSSTCVSNRGRPYDQDHCGWIAKERGCEWRDGRCQCSDGGYYSRTGRRCVPPSPAATTTETTTMASLLASTQVSNGSTCVSNKGLPYDQDHCGWIAKERGCEWRDARCQCADGGYYSRTGRRCVPPSPAATTTETTTMASLLASTQVSNGSTCVSNKGLPYDQDHCTWYGKARGCVWRDNQCMCQDGGYYSKTGRRCWPASPPTQLPTPAAPPSPRPKPSADSSFLDFMVAWFPGPRWLAFLLETSCGLGCCACTFSSTRQRLRICTRSQRQHMIQDPSQPLSQAVLLKLGLSCMFSVCKLV